MEPRISDGDLALVRRQTTLDNGDLGVMVYGLDGEGTLKKYIQRGNAVVLHPFNPAYEDLVIKGKNWTTSISQARSWRPRPSGESCFLSLSIAEPCSHNSDFQARGRKPGPDKPDPNTNATCSAAAVYFIYRAIG